MIASMVSVCENLIKSSNYVYEMRLLFLSIAPWINVSLIGVEAVILTDSDGSAC